MSYIGETDFLIEVNKGNVAGHTLVHKFGWRSGVTTTHHHLWNDSTADTDMIFPTVAETFDVVSASANDTSAGSGAQKVFIEGLDANFDVATFEATMNGVTPVPTTGQTFIRITRAYVTDVGTYGGTNAGLITISGTDSSNNYGFLDTDEAQTQNSQYTVPAGKTGHILNASMTVESNKLASLHLHKRLDAGDVTTPFTASRIVHEWDGISIPYNEDFRANHILPEKTDIWVEADMSSGTGIIEFDYDMLLVDN